MSIDFEDLSTAKDGSSLRQTVTVKKKK